MTMTNSPHITLTQPPPLGQPPHHTMATTIVNASTHTKTRSNGARFEPHSTKFDLVVVLVTVHCHCSHGTHGPTVNEELVKKKMKYENKKKHTYGSRCNIS